MGALRSPAWPERSKAGGSGGARTGTRAESGETRAASPPPGHGLGSGTRCRCPCGRPRNFRNLPACLRAAASSDHQSADSLPELWPASFFPLLSPALPTPRQHSTQYSKALQRILELHFATRRKPLITNVPTNSKLLIGVPVPVSWSKRSVARPFGRSVTRSNTATCAMC